MWDIVAVGMGVAMNCIALLFAVVTVMLTACGGESNDGGWFGSVHALDHKGPRGMHGDPSGTAAGIKQLLRYDANKDGSVTRAEMENGLHADFNSLDIDHNGKLDAGEARNENERRYKEDGPQYSPLIDWNQDGLIDFGEFAGTVHSLFDQLDKEHTGVLTPHELRAPRGPTLEVPQKPVNQRGG